MEIKPHLIEKINAFEHTTIADEINKMIAIKLKCKDLINYFRMCIVAKFRISNLWLNVVKIERKPNRKMLYTKNF